MLLIRTLTNLSHLVSCVWVHNTRWDDTHRASKWNEDKNISETIESVKRSIKTARKLFKESKETMTRTISCHCRHHHLRHWTTTCSIQKDGLVLFEFEFLRYSSCRRCVCAATPPWIIHNHKFCGRLETDKKNVYFTIQNTFQHFIIKLLLH